MASGRGAAEAETVFEQLELSFGVTAVNRRPHDLDWAKAVLSLISSAAASRTAKELVQAYQERQKNAPDRKLKGAAVWRRRGGL